MSVDGEFHVPDSKGRPLNTQEPQEYCLGFAFDEQQRQVLLIRKDRPEWQKGRLNGVGGKIEQLETAGAAMRREFEEETGIVTVLEDWHEYGVLQGPGFKIFLFFAHVSIEELARAQFSPPTSEQPLLLHPFNLPSRSDVLPNVPWLVQMALSFSRGERARGFRIEEY